MKTLFNLYGGPGTGKSTTCALLFAALKLKGVNAEMSREYVKDWVWEGREIQPGDASYFLAKQSRDQRNLMRQGLSAIITDAPLPIVAWYAQFDELAARTDIAQNMLEHHNETCVMYGYQQMHVFLVRTKEFNPAGRYQTEDEAKSIDGELKKMLDSMSLQYYTVEADKDAHLKILELAEI